MTTNNQTPPAGSPTDTDHIRVRARLLFPYVANSPIHFEKWEDSLRCIDGNFNHLTMGERVFDDGFGSLALNLNLAMRVIIASSIYPNGAVARVLLDEALSGAGSGDVDCVDRLLEKHWKVGIVLGYVQAKALHTFLYCGTPFDAWFLGQKKSQRMACGRDYFRVADTNMAYPKVYKRDNGQGEIYLCHEAAERAIMTTPTPRGGLAGKYLQTFRRGTSVF